MVNFGLNSASILGIFLAVGGAGLYFLRSFRPELSRDHDIFFAAIGLLCGFILIFQGWRLDPILQFGQFLLSASVVFFAVETVRLRGATTEQAKRASPRSSNDDNDYRPVTNAYTYTAELDELESVDDYPDSRRLRGTTRRGDDYDPEPPRRRAVPPRSTATPPESRSRRPSSANPSSAKSSRPSKVSDDDWDAPPPRPATEWSDESSRPSPSRPSDNSSNRSSSKRSSSRGSSPSSSSSPSRRPRPESSDDYSTSTWQEETPEPRSRRSRPQPPEDFNAPEDLPPRTRPNRDVPPPEDYVDFQPIDAPAPEDEEQPRGSEY